MTDYSRNRQAGGRKMALLETGPQTLYIYTMKKENVIILLIATFIVAFAAGAISGIRFYAREGKKNLTSDRTEAAPHAVGTGELNRLKAVVLKDPRNLQALVALGNLYFDSNQYPKAIDAYRKALALDPKNPDVHTDLGIMYRAVTDYDRAIKEFREAARLDPTHKNSRFNLGVVLQHDKKDLDGAIVAWEDFLKVEPSGERANMARTEIEQMRGRAK
jgi:cytochrome c-type biogenesis protein CcmH/NrfG